MKKYTEKELQAIANENYFKKNKDLKDILAVEDGHFFYSDRENYAISHAGENKIFLLKRSDEKPKPNPKVEKEVEVKVKADEKPKKDNKNTKKQN